MAMMTGAKLLADTVHGYGITHVFFHALYCAAGFDGDGEAGDQAGADARRESGRLYGRRLRPGQARAKPVYGAVGWGG